LRWENGKLGNWETRQRDDGVPTEPPARTARFPVPETLRQAQGRLYSRGLGGLSVPGRADWTRTEKAGLHPLVFLWVRRIPAARGEMDVRIEAKQNQEVASR
jgi:hypothetical protein